MLRTWKQSWQKPSKQKGRASPDGIVADFVTSLAWDNYDENCETLSGRGTVHDTVGISFQNVPTHPRIEPVQQNEPRPKRKMKRSFEAIEEGIEPYRKKPKTDTFEYESTDFSLPPRNLLQFQKLDNAWVASTYISNKTPMWVGWNSRLTTDELPMQNVCYMENICLPPTRRDVVVKTMEVSQKVAEEVNQDAVVVHYDLAIAKIARALKDMERPRFDNVCWRQAFQ